MTADDCNSQSTDSWFGEEPTRLRLAATYAACRLAGILQNWRGNRAADGFAILAYHRVSDVCPGVDAPTLNVTPERLRHQLTGLLARGFECWPLSRLIEAQREFRAIPPNAFAITFDDGYENNYLYAWPILRELKLPATIFLATKYLDTDRPFPFDNWSATGSNGVPAMSWRPLSTRQCEEMLSGGLIELGAHTHSHQRFPGRGAEFRRDMEVCLDVLREKFGIEHPSFAFPYGEKNPELTETCRQLGLACSLSTLRRRVSRLDDEHDWGRFGVDDSDTPAVIAAKLSGWYTTVAGAIKTVVLPWSPVAPAASARQTTDAANGDFISAEMARSTQ